MRVIFQWENGAMLGIETEGAAPPVGAVLTVHEFGSARILRAEVVRHEWELALPRDGILRTGAALVVVYLRPVAERP